MSRARKVPDMLTHSEDCGKFAGGDLWAIARSLPARKKNPLGTAVRRLDFRPSRATCGGFSLVELLVSMVVLGVIMGAVLTALSTTQEAYAVAEQQSDMFENVRGAAELMTQEIGQAGVVSLPSNPQPTLNAGTAVGATTAAVTSTTSMFNGEQLLIDTGNNKEELVQVNADPTATNIAFTPAFAFTHAVGASVTVLGVFPNGVVFPGTPDGSTSNAEPGISTLNLFGDINADGSLVYVRYTCDTTLTPGTLTRSVTTITPGNNAISTAQTLLSTLIPNPSNTACFIYTTNTVTNGCGTYNFVTNVGLTVSVRPLKPDPHTGTYLPMTKSFLDLAPRNMLAGFELANACNKNASLKVRLQGTPSNVLAY